MLKVFSTKTCLLVMKEKWNRKIMQKQKNGLDSGGGSAAASNDFSETFNCQPHELQQYELVVRSKSTYSK